MYPRTGFKSYVRGFDVITATSLTTTGDVTVQGVLVVPASNSTTNCPIQFAGDPNTGIRWIAGDQFGFVNGGGSSQTWTSTAISQNLATTIAAGNLTVTSGYIQLTEMAAPGAGAANTVRIYAVVDGGAKTDLSAIFQSGAAQIAAQEP